jgi:hypothetical protein
MGVEVQLQSFLTSALDVVEQCVSLSTCFIPGERATEEETGRPPERRENCPVFQHVVSYTGLRVKVLHSTRMNIFVGIPFNFFIAL